MPTTAVLLHGFRNPLATTERFSVGLAEALEDESAASDCAT